MKRVLVVARVFPPFRSVGHSIRMVKFIKYLPTFGWLPSVLTINDGREYEADRKQGSDSLLSEIPENVSIHRTAAGEPTWEFLEKERAFSQKNRLTRALEKLFGGARRWGFRHLLVPDRTILWLPFAVRRGRQIVKREEIDVILATCPPYSATLIGAVLKVFTRKPLIVDFRDDWVDTPWYHSRPAIVRLINRAMERWVVRVADKVVLVTDWSKRGFLDRYPRESRDKFVLLPNGCDLEEFPAIDPETTVPGNRRFTILHAGSLNDSKNWARTPAAIFQALRSIIEREPSLAGDVSLTFTGSLPDGHRRLIQELELSAVVTELGFLPRDEFIRFMHACGLLVVINYEGCATLIPGKIYEYWAVGGPPIMLLSCPGAAGELIEQHGLGVTLDPTDVAGIEHTIRAVYRESKSATPRRIQTAGIEAFDRKALTRQLARVLSAVSDPQS